MKKLFLAIILIFSLSFFCGCDSGNTAEISENFILLSLDLKANGTACQSIRFGLDSKNINSLASSLQEELEFKRNLILQASQIRNEFLFSFALIYVKNPVDEYKINQGVILTDVTYDEKGDYVGFDIMFTSLGAWNYYHATGESSNKPDNNGNIFFKKKTSRGTFPFSSKIVSGQTQKKVGEVYKERYLNAAKGLSFEEKIKTEYSPQFVYNYSTFSSKLKSDADLKYQNGRSHHHIWLVEEEDLSENDSISLSTILIYPGWWLFFALAMPLTGMTIAIIVVARKDKIKTSGKINKKFRKGKTS